MMNEYSMIECQFDTYKSIYAKGIYCEHIPFARAKKVRLLKCTAINGGVITHNILPALQLFQKAWKRRRAYIRNPRRLLAREMYGISIRPPPFRLGLH
jgi:hypothetical protein